MTDNMEMEMKDKVVVLSSTTIILGCAILSKCKLKKKTKSTNLVERLAPRKG